MSSPVVVIGGQAPARRRAAVRVHRGSDLSGTAGWLLLGAIAIAAIYWLTRSKVGMTLPLIRNAPNSLGPDPTGTVTTKVTAPGTTGTITIPTGGLPGGEVSCYDPRYAALLFPNEYIDQSGAQPRIFIHPPQNGGDYSGDYSPYTGCPNDVLRMRV